MSYWRFFCNDHYVDRGDVRLMYLKHLIAIDATCSLVINPQLIWRFYMGAVMAIIMLAFMLGMYSNRARICYLCMAKRAGFCRCPLFFGAQPDHSGMIPRGCAPLIPHPSIAILTSGARGQYIRPAVRKLGR